MVGIVHPRDHAEAQEVGLIPKPKEVVPTRERRLFRLVKAGNAEAHSIVQAPATASRAARRAIGLWGSIWKWDVNASEDMRRTYVPRYIRRHFTTAVPRTRRQRRVQARITRISRQKGLV